MARCPDCNKFVSFEEADPEINNIEIDERGHVTAQVRIVNTCADCGAELTEAILEMESDVEIPKEHIGGRHELSVEESGSARTSESGYFKNGKWIRGGGRYAKTFYGASINFEVTCSCGKMKTISGDMEDDEEANRMESLV